MYWCIIDLSIWLWSWESGSKVLAGGSIPDPAAMALGKIVTEESENQWNCLVSTSKLNGTPPKIILFLRDAGRILGLYKWLSHEPWFWGYHFRVLSTFADLSQKSPNSKRNQKHIFTLDTSATFATPPIFDLKRVWALIWFANAGRNSNNELASYTPRSLAEQQLFYEAWSRSDRQRASKICLTPSLRKQSFQCNCTKNHRQTGKPQTLMP